ncbi:putative dihydrodiol dehydrogenase [Mycobacterium xenopi 4042]|uniref:Putative dihydrodiol dehydrogenase n=1 Tax=Mycobacterium xenopi 4042 TaxID=1299334 RepID=X8CED6_MYCXE|nr:putative dihydrodiol dehydrogenase [Mycobacterium xenopi 4042]
MNDQPLTIANEFTEVVVRRVDTRNGSRLLISAPNPGGRSAWMPWSWRH